MHQHTNFNTGVYFVRATPGEARVRGVRRACVACCLIRMRQWPERRLAPCLLEVRGSRSSGL